MSISGQLVMPITIFTAFFVTDFTMATLFGTSRIELDLILAISVGSMIGYTFQSDLDNSLSQRNKNDK